ncbi:hypothetical protein BEP19_08405 [Ammoniphilus oxalaticus]|uniref:Probable membrane transporter protein n=1 Tax=Ammoniphilus oxalaticus TaxID=66863 RepID=A0A419SK96_9BACL|nr:sulfite exporter TauE/SafE family protein [Ammoniphilus oxalaticus]RKD24402.1 hypothetical protein BEP19_08405 [Ammoniphilus oxalaticus]
MTIFITMLLLGGLLGFVGAGGSGFIIAVLVTFFSIQIHVALATAMAAMFLTMATGAFSHFKQGNMDFKTGALIGLFGSVGSYLGTQVAHLIPEQALTSLTATMLIVSSGLIWYRTRAQQANKKSDGIDHIGLKIVGIGLVTGGMSGTFGIGSTPFIQLALISIMKKSLRVVAGTTMLIILPVAFFAAVGYSQSGYLDWTLLLKVISGTMIGSYIGAKFTNKAPLPLLRGAMISTPLTSGVLLFIQLIFLS